MTDETTPTDTTTSNPTEARDFTPRFRLNAKQTAKGMWYFDATIEVFGVDHLNLHKTEDEGDVRKQSIGERLQAIIADAEHHFVKNGRPLVVPPTAGESS